MEDSMMTRIVIETVVKKALAAIKEDPERETRNLVDMALQFAEGRFQQELFSTMQTMLQNEHSAYYGLVRDVVSHTDAERLLTFGMNVGYNGCTVGARHIRENERKLGCSIPWTVSIRPDGARWADDCARYDKLIGEGETLGIYVWAVFAGERPRDLLCLAKSHPASAFCVFCRGEDLTEVFLEEALEYDNIMLLVRYDEAAADVCASLRRMGLLYSVWYPYGAKDLEDILNGDLFYSAQQLAPAFTVLLARPECPVEVRRLVCRAVRAARNEQRFQTLLWEMESDNGLVDSIISKDSCLVAFDGAGRLCSGDGRTWGEHHDIFHGSLVEILQGAYPKTVEETA